MPTATFHPSNHTETEILGDASLFSFSEIGQVILKGWFVIFCTTLVCALIALAFAYFLPKKWEATTVISIARVPVLTFTSRETRLIQEPLQVIARIKQHEFIEKIIQDMNYPINNEQDRRVNLLSNTLKGVDIKNTDLIKLSVRSYSPDESINVLKYSVQELQKEHKKLFLPTKKRIVQEMQINNENLTDALTERSRLNAILSHMESNQDKDLFASHILAISLLNNNKSEIRKLKHEQTQHKSTLSSIDEQSTGLVDPIVVSKTPVFPKPKFLLALGVLLGLLIGCGMVILKHFKPRIN